MRRLIAVKRPRIAAVRVHADRLGPHAQRHGFPSPVGVFASSPFLGELKAELGDATRRVLAGTHDLDLTSFGLAEMEQRVQHELARAPG